MSLKCIDEERFTCGVSDCLELNWIGGSVKSFVKEVSVPMSCPRDFSYGGRMYGNHLCTYGHHPIISRGQRYKLSWYNHRFEFGSMILTRS